MVGDDTFRLPPTTKSNGTPLLLVSDGDVLAGERLEAGTDAIRDLLRRGRVESVAKATLFAPLHSLVQVVLLARRAAGRAAGGAAGGGRAALVASLAELGANLGLGLVEELLLGLLQWREGKQARAQRRGQLCCAPTLPRRGEAAEAGGVKQHVR